MDPSTPEDSNDKIITTQRRREFRSSSDMVVVVFYVLCSAFSKKEKKNWVDEKSQSLLALSDDSIISRQDCFSAIAVLFQWSCRGELN
jgi:hypothetical protein